ncbi:MAG: hypothetical protein WBA66_02820 [Xanthobacteraceae bacterium]
MNDKYGKMLDDVRSIVGEVRSRLRARGIESHDIGACLFQEALIELYGVDYGSALLATVAKRCIGYSEELMGIYIVDAARNTEGMPPEEIQKVEKAFNESQDGRVGRGMSVIERAAQAVTEKYGPFPATRDLR